MPSTIGGSLPFSNAGFVEGTCVPPMSDPVAVKSGFVEQPSFSFAQHHAFFSGGHDSFVRQSYAYVPDPVPVE